LVAELKLTPILVMRNHRNHFIVCHHGFVSFLASIIASAKLLIALAIANNARAFAI